MIVINTVGNQCVYCPILDKTDWFTDICIRVRVSTRKLTAPTKKQRKKYHLERGTQRTQKQLHSPPQLQQQQRCLAMSLQ